MNAGRTTKQGQQINIGKDSAEYQAIVSTITMHVDSLDMPESEDPVSLRGVPCGCARKTARRFSRARRERSRRE